MDSSGESFRGGLASKRFRALPLVILLGLLPIGPLQAHQDTRLTLEDGKITGLPEKYEPASFDRNKKVLTIGGKTFEFPEVLQKLFTDGRVEEGPLGKIEDKGHPYQLVLSASWYHDYFEILPPYLLMRIEPQGRDYSFKLLIDMDRLRFIRANVEFGTVGEIPIDLDGVVDQPKGVETGSKENRETKPDEKKEAEPEASGSTGPPPQR